MLIEIEGSRFNVSDKEQGFWGALNSGRWESATFRAIASQLKPQTTFLDLGAWIGPVTLFAATRAAKVVSFEPDPVAAAMLRENLALNPELSRKVTLLEQAVWSIPGVLRLGARRTQGDSMSSVLHQEADVSWEVEAFTPGELASLLADDDAPVFLKIDIEGAEYEVVPALQDILRRPNLAALVSFHPKFAAGKHFRWHKSFMLTHRVFKMFRGFKIYRVHKNSFRRAPLIEFLTLTSLPIFETRITYLFVGPRQAE